MPLFNDIIVNPHPGYLEDYATSGFGEAFGANLERNFLSNPTVSATLSGQLGVAQYGVPRYPGDVTQQPDGSYVMGSGPTSPLVDAVSARQRIKDENLNIAVPDSGIRQAALDILIQSKQAERRRNDIINRSAGGFFQGAANIAGGVAVSALDPLNVASAFIPVLPEARYAALVAKAATPIGRAGVRAAIGGVEGAIGNAAVEPIVYASQRQQQADYGLADSVMNIALGTLLGGGLHVGAGAVADAVKGGRAWQTAEPADGPIPRLLDSADRATREAMLRTGVAQAVTGRDLNLEPVVSYAGQNNFEQPLRASFGPAEVPRVDAVTGVEGFTVYHGSPHTFGRFSMEYIGTGEGAQAFGYGLYMAQSKAVARGYQKSTSFGGPVALKIGDERINTSASSDAATRHAGLLLRSGLGDYEYAIKETANLSTRKLADDAAAILREWQAKGAELVGGNIYEVRIRAHPDDFLDWDKPLSEQSPKVREALAGLGIKAGSRGKPADWLSEATGIKEFVETGASAYEGMGKAANATAVLRDAGIPGIRYLDQGSRGNVTSYDVGSPQTDFGPYSNYRNRADAEKQLELLRSQGFKDAEIKERTAPSGTSNFVVFDDKLLHIIRRNDEFIAQQPQDLQAKAQASFNPENSSFYDGASIKRADQQLAAAPSDEAMPDATLQQTMEDVTRLAASLGDPEIVAREMADVNELEKTATEYGEAVKTAADCRARRG